jgi:predicted hydrocarbon binding protein
LANNKKKKRHYEKEILEFIKNASSGITITDIYNGLEKEGRPISRTTIDKYITKLEAKEEIISKKIGAYSLYRSSDVELVSVNTVRLTYVALLVGFKEKMVGELKENFKHIGRKYNDYIIFPVGSEIPEEVTIPNSEGSYKKLLKYYARRYTYMDYVINKDVIVDPVFETNNKVVYRFSNVRYIPEIEGFNLHFYVIAGVIEGIFERVTGKKVQCEVTRIENDQVDLLIEILA